MFFAVESGLASSVVAIFLVNDPNRGWEQKQYKLRVEETKQLLDRVNAVNIHLCTIYTHLLIILRHNMIIIILQTLQHTCVMSDAIYILKHAIHQGTPVSPHGMHNGVR